jgi:hypothetical protein
MTSAPIYQLITHGPGLQAITHCVSADIRNLSDAATRAIGRQGWVYADLLVVTWLDGQSSDPVAWSNF